MTILQKKHLTKYLKINKYTKSHKKHSTWHKLLNVVAFMLQFINLCKQNDNKNKHLNADKKKAKKIF